jgi:hypothetical protein
MDLKHLKIAQRPIQKLLIAPKIIKLYLLNYRRIIIIKNKKISKRNQSI